MSKRSYWAGTGTYQAEFKRLRTLLVPVDGAAETPHGELLRAVGRLYYHLKSDDLGDLAARWEEWRVVCSHRDQLIEAIGVKGSWVFAVVDRAVTERYLIDEADAEFAPRPFPEDAFERLLDGCVLTVRSLHLTAA